MRRRIVFRVWALTTLAAGGSWLGSATARAGTPSCSVDSDCTHGFTCQATGAGGCPASPPCPADAPCAPVPECQSTETKTCLPGPCASASDCAADMVCLPQSTSITCSGVGSSSCSDAGCPPVVVTPPPTCTMQATSACVQRYDADCKVDSDCGPNFTCTPVPSACACPGFSGSGGGTAVPVVGASSPPPVDASASGPAIFVEPAPAPAVDAGTIAFGVDAGCYCPPSDQSSCVLNVVTCKVDTDCPASWTCEIENNIACASTSPAPEPTGVTNGGAGGGTKSSGANSGSTLPPSGGTPVDVFTCPDAGPPVGQCVPPYWDIPIYNGLTAGQASSMSSGVAGTTSNAFGSSGAGSGPTGSKAPSPSAQPGGGGNSSNTTTGAPVVAPTAAGQPGSSKGPDDSDGGCRVAAGSDGATGNALGILLAFAGFVRGRRRRA